MKILELFSGYGTASFALKQLGIDYECVGYSDIDKYANQCFQQNHGGKELGDCTKVDPNDLEDFDLLTGGFPCQAFSVAGKMLGELDTRGTLFNEIIRIAEVKKPKYMLLENVKGLTSKRHGGTFNKIISEIQRIGYRVTWEILNTKEHGIPQNRERIFFVCFLDNGRDFPEKDFVWPEKEELKIFLKDILEEDVDEKYYLNKDVTNKLIASIDWEKKEEFDNINSDKLMQMNNPVHSTNRVYHINGVGRCLRGSAGGLGAKTGAYFIAIKNATKRGYLEGYPGDGVNLEHPDSKTRRGRIQKDVMGCLQTNDQRGVITEDFRIRKLTPKESFRLQGFINDEVKVEGISNSQQYKLAGNGQSVNVVKKIFSSLFLNKESQE